MRLGLSYSVSDTGTIPMVRVGDLTRPIRWQAVQRAEVEASDVSDLLLQDGDILLARSGVGSVGNVQAVVNPPVAVFASYVIRIRPAQGWHGLYVCYYLKSPAGQRALHERAQGATILNLSASRISSIAIPQVSLSQQRAIAAALQDAEASYLSAEEKLEQAKAGIEHLKRRIYVSAIESTEIREDSDSWDVTDLGTIADNRDRGRVPLNADERKQVNGDVPYYGASGVIDHVNGSTHDGTFVLVSEDGRNLLNRNLNIAFVASGKFWANNHVHILEPHSSILPEFLALQINSLDLKGFVTGTDQAKLSQSALNRIPIRVPSLDVQRTLLQIAAELESSYIRLLNKQGLVASHLSTAWAEILDQAFRSTDTSIRSLALEEALQWLEEVVPMLRSDLGEVGLSDVSSSGAGQASRDQQSGSPSGWLTVKQAFNDRYQKIPPDELEETVDDFYAWLKSSLISGEVELKREDEEAYLRIRP
jgi:type I restriction enzyme S subunit